MGGYVRSAESHVIYASHGIKGDFQPETLAGNTVVALALDLLAFEWERQKQRVVGISTHDPV